MKFQIIFSIILVVILLALAAMSGQFGPSAQNESDAPVMQQSVPEPAGQSELKNFKMS